MSERPAFDAAEAQRLSRRMRWVNVPMRFVLGMPFPTPLGGRLMLVTSRDASPVGRNGNQ
jgi:hypothetical protein